MFLVQDCWAAPTWTGVLSLPLAWAVRLVQCPLLHGRTAPLPKTDSANSAESDRIRYEMCALGARPQPDAFSLLFSRLDPRCCLSWVNPEACFGVMSAGFCDYILVLETWGIGLSVASALCLWLCLCLALAHWIQTRPSTHDQLPEPQAQFQETPVANYY